MSCFEARENPVHQINSHTPNQEAWLLSSCSRGSEIPVSSGMTGELNPNTNPKLMGPRTEANVARYNFLFFTLLGRERGTEQFVGGKGQCSVCQTKKKNNLSSAYTCSCITKCPQLTEGLKTFKETIYNFVFCF